jgi:hypothetical protein
MKKNIINKGGNIQWDVDVVMDF